MGYEKMDKKFDVKNGGQHQLCIQNQSNGEIEAEISIKTGEWSEEKSAKITKKHLVPVEEQAAKVDSLVEEIRKDMN